MGFNNFWTFLSIYESAKDNEKIFTYNYLQCLSICRFIQSFIPLLKKKFFFIFKNISLSKKKNYLFI